MVALDWIMHQLLLIIKMELTLTVSQSHIITSCNLTESKHWAGWLVRLHLLLLCFHLSSEVYHYQFRIQFVNQMENMEPSLSISLTGTQEESGNLRISLWVLNPPPPPPHVGLTWHHIHAQWTLNPLIHAICSWALNAVVEKKKASWGEQLTHMETAPAWKRTANGDDGVNYLLETLFTNKWVWSLVFCVSKSRGNLKCCSAADFCHNRGSLLCCKETWRPSAGCSLL